MDRRPPTLLALLALGALMLVHGCTDETPIPTEPDVQLGVPPAAAAVEARANGLLKDLYPPPTLRRDANRFFADLKSAVARGDGEAAQELLFAFLADAVDHLNDGNLSDPPGPATTEEALGDLGAALLELAGIAAGTSDTDVAAAVVEPNNSETTITTESEFAGTTIPGGAVDETVVVTIQRREDVVATTCLPLPASVSQFEGCYQFDVTPDQDFNEHVTVGVCLESGPDPDAVRLHKFRPEEPELGVKPLPNATAAFLDCSGFTPVAFDGGGPLTRFASRGMSALGRLLMPEPLGAAHTGSGGLAINFSDVGWAEDNTLTFDSDSLGTFDIFRMDSDGAHVAALTVDPAFDGNPKWSPDGSRIAFRSARSGSAQVWIMNADGTGLTQVTSTPGFNNPHSWFPSGDSLVISDVGPNGFLAAFVIATDGTNKHLVVDSAGSGAISPDGTRIAVEKSDPVTGFLQIVTANTDGTGQTQLTTLGGARPAWSPDGSQIAFTTGRDGNLEVYVMDADGSNQVNITNHPATDTEPAWSGDGGRIAFETNRDGDVEIYLMDPDGGDPINVSNNSASNEGNPDWIR